jgi:DHA1 family bicyclomycin/chloramphenicol resistance-like MFS transporter
MSFVMAVFILVPVVAPAFGQAILMVGHWRWIFGVLLIIVMLIGIWFAWRQPETLSPDSRTPFSLATIGRAIQEAVTHRMVFGYTIAIGLVFGAFIGYLNSAQQVFQEQYGLGTLFPLYFALLALSLGCAFIANSRLVMRFGLHEISFLALKSIVALSIVFFGVATITDGQPPLWSLTLYFILTFFGLGILFGNLNALAMKPLGHIAGVGAAVVGSLSTFISLLLGTFIGQCYDGTVLPMIGGFAIYSITAIMVMRWVESKEPLPQASQ